MFSIPLLAILFYLGWRATYKNKKKGRKSGLFSATPATHAQQSGELGEQRTQAMLREVLPQLCGADFYLHEGPLIIEHAPGTAFPTAEIDHLAITPFGTFVFETKNWTGEIAGSDFDDQLVRTAIDGTREVRKSPLAQNRSKVAFLASHLPPFWPVGSAGVFTSDDVRLDPRLPLNLVTLAGLPQWLRTERQKFGDKPKVDVQRAKQGVLMYADLTQGAAKRHQDRVRTDA